MAQAMVTPTIRKRAEELADRMHLLPRGRSKINGAGFHLVPGSTEGTAYYSNYLGCTCPGFQHRGVCAHQQAALLVQQRYERERFALAAQRRAAAPKPRKSYADLFPDEDY